MTLSLALTPTLTPTPTLTLTLAVLTLAVRYDAVHGPPVGSALDEQRLKQQREAGVGYLPLYPERADGSDEHTSADEAWAAMVAASNQKRAAGGRRGVQGRDATSGGGGGGGGGGGSAEGREVVSAPAAWAEVDDDAGGVSAWAAEEREDCGYPGITKEECVDERGCRWDDSAVGLAWCFL